MNKQEIFDKIATHLLTQMCKARNAYGLCQYKTVEGLKCAIGCLIPDGHPAQWAIGGVDGLLQGWPELGTLWGVPSPFPRDIRHMLAEMQVLHDRHEVDSWRDSLIGYAQQNDLHTAAINDLI